MLMVPEVVEALVAALVLHRPLGWMVHRCGRHRSLRSARITPSRVGWRDLSIRVPPKLSGHQRSRLLNLGVQGLHAPGRSVLPVVCSRQACSRMAL